MLIYARAVSAVSVSCLGLQNGCTALQYASWRGHQGVVEALMTQGANLEAKSNVSSSFTPEAL
jgi:ankyrin repeat protein